MSIQERVSLDVPARLLSIELVVDSISDQLNYNTKSSIEYRVVW